MKYIFGFEMRQIDNYDSIELTKEQTRLLDWLMERGYLNEQVVVIPLKSDGEFEKI